MYQVSKEVGVMKGEWGRGLQVRRNGNELKGGRNTIKMVCRYVSKE